MSMNIWEERYCDEKWGLETPASFRYFQLYIQQSYPREIKALHKTLETQTEMESKTRTPKLQTLYDYSMKWKWVERAEAYDEYLKQLHFKTKENEVMEWESEQLKLAKQRAKLHSDTLNKIHKADEDLFPLTKKAYAEETNERAYNESIDAVYKLLHGGVIKQENRTKTDMNLDADVKQETLIKTEKSVFDELKEIDKELSEIYDTPKNTNNKTK